MSNTVIPADDTALPESMPRRDVLRGLVTIPVIAGTLSLFGCDLAPAPIALVTSASAATTATSTPDAMVALLARYEAGLAAYEALDLSNASDEEETKVSQRLYGDIFDELCENTPPVTTMAGAVAALRFCHQEGKHFLYSHANMPILAAVLTFLEGAANG